MARKLKKVFVPTVEDGDALAARLEPCPYCRTKNSRFAVCRTCGLVFCPACMRPVARAGGFLLAFMLSLSPDTFLAECAYDDQAAANDRASRG